ncbi:MAG: hypothetical protein K0R89_1597 [Ramlibacter sp.]|jgi:hypothetical protein|nr:hypothetical protein [Ramlibacter sp.]MCD6077659.1 hypothetical protein [Ramlibacter sp.]
MTHTIAQIAVIAAFAVSGAAFAQKAAETTNTPQRAGEASTMTGGAPNAKTTNATTTSSTAGKASTAASGSKGTTSSSGKGSASATTNVPDRAGQASTMTNGVPNKKTTN